MINTVNPHRLAVFALSDFIAAIKSDFGLDILDVEKIEQGYASQVYRASLDGKEIFIKINDNPQVFPVEVLGYSILKELGIPAPSVIVYQERPQTIGYSTIILSGAEGTKVSAAHLTPEEEDAIFTQMGGIMKKIHGVKLEGFGRPVAEGGKLRGEFDSWKESQEKLERYYRGHLETIEKNDLLTTEELEVLDKAIKETSSAYIEQGSLLHRDLHRGHVFIKGDKVTGIIDLGSVGIGDPRFDIAMSMVFQNPVQQECFKKGYGDLANDSLVNKYVLCIAAGKIVFRTKQGNKEGVEEAVTVFRRTALQASSE